MRVIVFTVVIVLTGCASTRNSGESVDMAGVGLEAKGSSDMQTSMNMLGHENMHGQLVEIDPEIPKPSMAAKINRDEADGFNIHIDIENFLLESPMGLTTEEIEGKELLRGHAHVYLNDVKLVRLYGPDVHLPIRIFPKGVSKLVISINNHNHQSFSSKGEPLQITIFLDPGRDRFLLSNHSSSPIR